MRKALRLIPTPPKPPQTRVNIEDLEVYLKELTASGTPPGLSLIVVKKGKIVYNNAFGVADGPSHILATPETIYHWWSLTKIFTAVAVLQLHEQGRLDIAEPVAAYLPFFQIKYPFQSRQTISIRHLLNHSSGLPNNPIRIMGWIHPEDEPAWNQTELIKTVLPDYTKLKFEPDTQALYTNIGYMLLGAIIETVSGQTYEDYVLQYLLQPLKMNHTGFVYTPQMLPNAAVGSHPLLRLETLLFPFLVKNMAGYIREIRGGKIWFKRLYNDQTPPSGLIGPTTDLVRFLAAYLNDGELEGTRILLPETIALMNKDSHVSTKNGQVRGLGWVISPKTSSRQHPYLQHCGEGPGFASTMRIYPERSLGLAVIANDATYDRSVILDLTASIY